MFLSEWREFSFGALLCRGEKKCDDSSRLDVVEIVRVPDMFPSLFPSGRFKDLSASRYFGFFFKPSSVSVGYFNINLTPL